MASASRLFERPGPHRQAVKMKRILRGILSVAVSGMLLLTLGACAGMTRQQQRTLSGGAIGAAAGGAVALIADTNPVVGILVGAGGGAAVGALTNIGASKH